ncbi:MAG TPA: GIY-YIG nuclease family protein [Candidatus Paceibacterota bacterium]|nr:GIY-YIG nuclease family protein [Candidatus Paceibacterota bacterium]
MYFVYLLECGDRSIYTGITTDVERRFQEHRKGIGSAYTRSRKVLKILYTEKYRTRSGASKREAAIKRLARKEKLILISRSRSANAPRGV